MNSVTIELPLPHKNLSPNSRCHYMAKATATKKARRDARHASALAWYQWAIIAPQWAEATVQATFYFKDRRKRDRDNLLASLKASFDGLADSRLIANDSGLTHLPVKVDVDKKNPRVVLTVTPNAMEHLEALDDATDNT